MKFNTGISHKYFPEFERPLDRAYQQAEFLEELGYNGIFIGHHSFSPETGDSSAPLTTLAAIAARTERLRLGTGIFLAPLHHPVNICEQLSTLDQISNGRAMFGVAPGYRDYEYEGLGVPFAERGPRLNEIIKILKQAWSTGRYGYDGEYYKIPDLTVHPGAVQPGGPPILVGGTSKPALRRAAQLGDAWYSLPMETLPKVTELAEFYRAECRKAGTQPRIVLMREAWVAPSAEDIESQWLDRALGFHKHYWDAGTEGDIHDPVLQRVAAGERVGCEEFAHDRAIAGTPEFCISELKRWHDAIGFDEINVMFLTNFHTVEGAQGGKGSVREVAKMFAEEVIPEFSST